MQRCSGVLLHISSLPSPYGIGAFGKSAYAFVDFLVRAGQRRWQVLPLGPTSYGDSPYQSFSAAAGNPYFIDLDMLIDDGLLSQADAAAPDWGSDPAHVDFGRIYAHRFAVLRKAYEAAAADEGRMRALDAFIAQNAAWLNDYALFMALKDAHRGAPWTEWETPLRMREPNALDAARIRESDGIRFYSYLQFLFFAQWRLLKAYANEHGVRIIGDLPIYVPLDSADVWAEPAQFQLDAARMPLAVAGVPPDYFSADGQLWGNPLYDWGAMRADGYGWWMRRLDAVSRLYDVVRIDHFRAFSTYWRVPMGEKTARVGEWVRGPGMDFIGAVQARFPAMEIIAEDLGCLSEDVYALVRESGLPGMKVLEFAFSPGEPSEYLPHAYPRGCVCYTGTHDNATITGWFSEASEAEIDTAVRYLGLNEREGYHWGMLRGGMGSVADLFVAQMQDFLGLGASARMNVPGTLGGTNWQWRLLPGQLDDALADRMREYARIYGRL